MRRFAVYVLCAVLLALTACVREETDQVSTPETSNQPETSYETRAFFDPDTMIQRTVLQSQGMPLSVYFEIPVFPETSEGYQKINQFFEELRDSFFLSDDFERTFHAAKPGNSIVYNRWDARIVSYTGQLVSVVLDNNWYMEGAEPFRQTGKCGYTFRADTGELLALTDLVDGTEEEIRELILSAVSEQYGEETADLQSERPIESFEFYVEYSGIWIVFRPDEVPYVYDGLTVKLDTKLSERVDEWFPELCYETTTSFNSEIGIQRTTLDPQGSGLSVYFEIPVFEEVSEGYRNINQFFEGLRDDFFSPDNKSLTTAWGSRNECIAMPRTFFYERDAKVMTQTNSLLSVSIGYSWYMGGVNDTGSDSYNFDPVTGELLCLTDIAEGTEEELDAAIRDALYAAQEWICLEPELLADYTPNDFEFYVNDGKIYLCFDRYEAGAGFVGSFTVELPVVLRSEYR